MPKSIKMPDELHGHEHFERLLNFLQDDTLNYLKRSEYYKNIKEYLDNDIPISNVATKALLQTCVSDLKKDVKYAVPILKLILMLIKRIKNGNQFLNNAEGELKDTLASVVHILTVTAPLNKVQSLQELCLEVLLQFPDDIFKLLGTIHIKDLLTITKQCLRGNGLQSQIEYMILTTVIRLLQVLPEIQRKEFVKNGLSVWFSKVVPMMMSYASVRDKAIVATELISSDLTTITYFDNYEWKILAKNIATKYPKELITMLKNKEENWSRIWICFVKLLGKELHRPGSPINTLLTVVENAFKLQNSDRNRALDCWKALIENFALDINELFTPKRLKLLSVPLKVNNAKCREVAVTKFEVWWYLLTKVQTRIKSCADLLLIPFLHFCFGIRTQGKVVPMPGNTFEPVKELTLEAFVEIVGHYDCNGCTSNVQKLDKPLISMNLLRDYTNEWMFSIKQSILRCAKPNDLKLQYLNCIWNSSIKLILEGNDRAIIEALMFVLGELVEESMTKEYISEIVLKIILELPKHFELIIQNNDHMISGMPMYSWLAKMILCPTFSKFFDSENSEYIVKLKAAMDMGIKMHPELFIKGIISELPSTDSSMMLWKTIAEATMYSDEVPEDIIKDILRWPIIRMELFSEMKNSAQVWVKLFNKAINNDKMHGFAVSIKTMILLQHTEINEVERIFYLFVLPAVMKACITSDNFSKDVCFNKEFKFLSKVLDIKSVPASLIMEVAPGLSDMLLTFAQLSTGGQKQDWSMEMLKLACTLVKNLTPHMVGNANLEETLQRILESISKIFYTQSEHQEMFVKSIFDDEGFLNSLATCVVSKEPVIDQFALKIAKDISLKLNGSLKSKTLTKILKKLPDVPLQQPRQENKKNERLATKSIAKDSEFAVPAKKKKCQSTIVKKVTENNEEYVVVKSNWKFDPKKLTDHQKEVLTRKREDIPALYQDLSQSQEEMSVKSWKLPGYSSDSQDGSSSTSNSKKDSRPTTLKDVLNPEICPKIMNNIFTENKSVLIDDTLGSGKKSKENINSLPTKVGTNKITTSAQSPKITLKDSMKTKIKNLVGTNDGPKVTYYDDATLKNMSEEGLLTPQADKKSSSQQSKRSMSAPPKTISERPSRNIRRPKKLDTDFETESFLTKKRKTVHHKNDGLDIIQGIDKFEFDGVAKSSDKLNANTSTTFDTFEHNIDKKITNIISDSTKDKSVALVKLTNAKKIRKFNKESVSETSDKLIKSNQTSFDDQTEKNKAFDVASESCNDRSVSLINPEQNNAKKAIFQTNMDVALKKSHQNKDTLPKSTNSVEEGLIIQDLTKDDNIKMTLEENETAYLQTQPIDNNSSSEIAPCLPNLPKKKKSKLIRELAIDTVEGHPLFRLNDSPHRDSYPKRSSRCSNSRERVLSVPQGKIENETAHSRSSKCSNSKETVLSASQENNSNDTAHTNPNVKVPKNSGTESNNMKMTKSYLNDSCNESDDFIESSQESTFSIVRDLKVSLNRISDDIVKVPLKSSLTQCSSEIIIIEDNVPAECIEIDTQDTMVSESQSTATADTLTFVENDHHNESTICDEDLKCSESIEVTKLSNMPENTSNTEAENIAGADTETMTSSNDIFNSLHNNSDKNVSKLSLSISSNEKNDVLLKDNNIEVISSKSIAEADTEPMETTALESNQSEDSHDKLDKISINGFTRENDTPPPNSPPNGFSSHYRDDVERNQEFLNNTMDISPIKVVQAERDSLAPSPVHSENSNDYFIVKLVSPVRPNGEPIDPAIESPEMFTEETVQDNQLSPEEFSPEISPSNEDDIACKPDQSPPRKASNIPGSPSLSLKKRAPVRQSGRAAQMLGLCAPHKVHSLITNQKCDQDGPEKRIILPVRRNLKSSYMFSNNDEADVDDDSGEEFLKFTKPIPSSECSPIGPILKRKLDVSDDATRSPKRKRVSFHDPPVSTTVAVQKYIEPTGIRSPSNRKQSPHRHQPAKSLVKKLENEYKADISSKLAENFENTDFTVDSDLCSIESTLSLQVVRHDELNDVDAICPELINCNDPISAIASELSSSATKDDLIKELHGTVHTIGDLATLTEREVNRLCIKAPKIQTVKKVLTSYRNACLIDKELAKLVTVDKDIQTEDLIEIDDSRKVVSIDQEIQTEKHVIETKDSENQTNLKQETIFAQVISEKTPDVILDHCLTQIPEYESVIKKHVFKSLTVKDIQSKCKSSPEFKSAIKNDVLNSLIVKDFDSESCTPDCKDVKIKVLKSIKAEEFTEQTSHCQEIKNLVLETVSATDLISLPEDKLLDLVFNVLNIVQSKDKVSNGIVNFLVGNLGARAITDLYVKALNAKLPPD